MQSTSTQPIHFRNIPPGRHSARSAAGALSTLLLLLVFGQLPAQPAGPAGKSKGAFFTRFDRSARPAAAAAPRVLREQLQLGPNDQLVALQTGQDGLGFTTQRFGHYYKGIRVEYGELRAHSRNGLIQSLSGEHYAVPNLAVQPTLSENAALQRALAYVGAKTYRWQKSEDEQWLKKHRNDPKATFYPKGELVICRDYVNNPDALNLVLAYKFDVYATEPLSRDYIYVNAANGQVVHRNPIIKHAEGPADTRYSGTRPIRTEAHDATYRLRDPSRGNGVETYNLGRGINYNAAVDFTDDDNHWSSAEFDNAKKDNAALDAHWGAGVTYDYWKNVHNRLSFDGNNAKLKSYVHYGFNYNNAFWDGYVMTYGDGGGEDAYTCLDIVAHEIGHGITQHTAGLVYSYESGAINEGFSDIWGAVIEQYATSGKQNWLVAEDIYPNNGYMRSMSDPNARFNPDTYKGQYWYSGAGDNGGVHFNSGVINHWFYLLSVGKTDVNDFGEAYAVTGIGIDKAARIAYRTLSMYLTANSQYPHVRKYAIQAAVDLYGEGSTEATQTAAAWRAVGVASDQLAAPGNLTYNLTLPSQVNLYWEDHSDNETGFVVTRTVNRPDAPAETVATLGPNVTTFSHSGIVAGNYYYYQVKAVNTTLNLTSNYSNQITATLGSPAAPSQVRAAVLSDGRVDITWQDNSTNETEFVVRRANGYYSSYAEIGRVGAGVTAYSDLTVVPGKTYYYSVQSLLQHVTSSASPPVQASVGFPAAPGGLQGTVAGTALINLSWTDNSDNETHFVVERSLAAGNGYAPLGQVAAGTTAFADSTVTPGRVYYYRVKALRADFNVSSGYSNVAAVPLGTINAPSVLAATVVSETQVNLSWTDNSDNESHFLVERSTNANNSFTSLGQVDAGTTAFTDAAVMPGQFYYRVKAISAGGIASAYSNVAGAPIGIPATPTELSATGVSDTQVNLTWSDNATNETHYVIYRSLSYSGEYPAIDTLDANTESYSDQTAAPGKYHYYHVQAVRTDYGVGSGLSNKASLPVGIPAYPSGVTLTVVSPTRVDMTWTDQSENESLFTIDRSLSMTSGYVQIGQVDAGVTFFSDTTVVTGNTYYYRVRAYRADVDVYSGFTTTWVRVGDLLVMSNTAVTTCDAIFTDPGGSSHYPNNTDVTMTVSPEGAGKAVRINFLDFYTYPDDFLYVYDGASTSAPLLGRFSSASRPRTLTATNPEGKLTFRFVSNDFGNITGWEAKLSCVPLPNYLTMTPAPVSACEGIFVDPGRLDNYPSNADVTTVLGPGGPDQAVRLAFTKFSTEYNFDFLYLYDGTGTDAPLVGKYSGKALPPAVTATNPEGKLTLRFTSDYATALAGWEATLTCVPRPVAEPQSLTTPEDTQREITLSGTGYPSLAYAVVTPPAHGTLSGTAPDLMYTPDADYHGSDAFTFTVAAGGMTSLPATVSLNVTPVNDAPFFTKGAKQVVDEDAGYQTVPGWVTQIKPGPADEAGQTLVFYATVTGSTRPGLFTAAPAIAPDGTLTYQPAPGAYGTATVSVVLKDNGGRANGGVDESPAQTFTITVNPVNDTPVVTASLSSQSGQYSDPVTPVALAATDADGDPLSATASWMKAGNLAFAPGLPAGLTLTAGSPYTWTLAGKLNVAPGVYTVRITVDDGTGAPNGSAYIHLIFTVTEEDAVTTYTGTTFAFTAGTRSTTANVLLTATVQDVSATGPGDASPGDIAKATVKFRITQVTTGGETFVKEVPAASLTYVNATDPRTAIATANWTADIGAADAVMYKAYLLVGGYYRESPVNQEVITVSKALSDFVAGGGSILPQAPAGLLSGSGVSVGKTSFGASIKYTKNGASPKGFVNLLIRRKVDGVVQVLQVKNNAFSSFGVQRTTPARSTVVTKASVQEIGTGTIVDWGGNYTMSLSLVDNGTPGTKDLISITVYDKDNKLWYAANWNGMKSLEQNLTSGNLSINSSSSFGPTTTRVSAAQEGALGTVSLRSYPNPFWTETTIEFSLPKAQDYALEVYDAKGVMVARLQEGHAGAGELKEVHWRPAKNLSGVYLLRLTTSQGVQHLKLMLR